MCQSFHRLASPALGTIAAFALVPRMPRRT